MTDCFSSGRCCAQSDILSVRSRKASCPVRTARQEPRRIRQTPPFLPLPPPSFLPGLHLVLLSVPPPPPPPPPRSAPSNLSLTRPQDCGSVCVPQVFLWCSSGVPLVFLRCSSGVPQVFLRCSSGVPLVFLRCSSGVPQVFLWCSSGVPQVFLWCSSGVPLVFLRCSSSVPQVFLWCSSGVPQVFLKCSSGVPLVFLSVSAVCVRSIELQPSLCTDSTGGVERNIPVMCVVMEERAAAPAAQLCP
ncbi:uncharacterized protein V6R79_023742 [Siganus canaliculatus]